MNMESTGIFILTGVCVTLLCLFGVHYSVFACCLPPQNGRKVCQQHLAIVMPKVGLVAEGPPKKNSLRATFSSLLEDYLPLLCIPSQKQVFLSSQEYRIAGLIVPMHMSKKSQCPSSIEPLIIKWCQNDGQFCLFLCVLLIIFRMFNNAVIQILLKENK